MQNKTLIKDNLDIDFIYVAGKNQAAKEKVDNVVGEVREKTTETVEKSKNVITTTKGKTWWNRIWSAAVGAVVAVGAMFGITNDQIAEQKEKVEE